MDNVQQFLHANKHQLGYIMHEASRIWNENVPGGAFTVGECYKTVENHGTYNQLLEENERLRSALKTIRWSIEATNPQAWRMREIAHEALYDDGGENK